MQRLTDKYGTTKCDNVARVLKNGTNNEFVIGGKAIAKLKEFEDFMEQEEFESIEDLKSYIKLQSNGSKELIQYNQQLNNNWQELKKYVEKYADNFDEGIASICDLILMKMKKLEKDD